MPKKLKEPKPQRMDQPVQVFDGFLSDAECDHVIALSTEKLAPSSVVHHQTGESVPDPVRTSYNCFIARGTDQIIADIDARCSMLTGIPEEHGEDLQVLRYQLDQKYEPHHDYFDPVYEGSKKTLENGGQRTVTVLLYLSDVEEGGETKFPLKNTQVTPKKGRAVLFKSTYPDGELDPKSLHGSNPVIKGEKWAANKWYRERPFI